VSAARILDGTIPSSAVLVDGRVVEVESDAALVALSVSSPIRTTIVDPRGFPGASWPRKLVVGRLLGLASCDDGPTRIAPPATPREAVILCHAGELGGAWIAYGRLGPRKSARSASRDSRGRLMRVVVDGEILARCEWDDHPTREIGDAHLRLLRDAGPEIAGFLVATYDPRS
jgi:hypothetical protein